MGPSGPMQRYWYVASQLPLRSRGSVTGYEYYYQWNAAPSKQWTYQLLAAGRDCCCVAAVGSNRVVTTFSNNSVTRVTSNSNDRTDITIKITSSRVGVTLCRGVTTTSRVSTCSTNVSTYSTMNSTVSTMCSITDTTSYTNNTGVLFLLIVGVTINLQLGAIPRCRV